MLMEEEERIVSECFAESSDEVLGMDDSEPNRINRTDKYKNGYFNKYAQLKKYLYKKDAKFIELQQDHLKSIKMIYAMLTPEQKQKLIRNFFSLLFFCFIFKLRYFINFQLTVRNQDLCCPTSLRGLQPDLNLSHPIMSQKKILMIWTKKNIALKSKRIQL